MSFSINRNTTFFSYFNRIFFWVLLSEVMLGGAGRILDFGGITLRMVFFIIALIITIIYIIHGYSLNRYVVSFVLFFLLVIIVGIIVGFIDNEDRSIMLENILMNSYFLMFPFFDLMIREKKDVKKVVFIFKICSCILATFYLLFLVILFLKLIPFQVLYELLRNPEFAFRGESAFFYKGFLFMCCGFFFFLSSQRRRATIGAVLILISVILTFMRGFILALGCTYMFYYAFIKNIIIGILLIFLITVSFSYVSNLYNSVVGDRTESDDIRYAQLHQVKERTTPFSIVIGHGFGYGVPIRSNHFEINFLEIFFKQGLIGFFFWFSLFGCTLLKYLNAIKAGFEKEARPFLLSVFFLYIQSMTNPFLSNSMGITIVFLSLCCLNVLSDSKQ